MECERFRENFSRLIKCVLDLAMILLPNELVATETMDPTVAAKDYSKLHSPTGGVG